MLCLSDTDLVLKLCAMNIADRAFKVMGVDRSEIRITPELGSYLKHRAPLKHPRDVVARATDFIKGLKLVPSADHDDVAVLSEQPDIQAGERILFASTAKLRSDFLVATGDKKSLRALAASDNCKHIYDRLKNRCVCFEQFVLATVEDKGFDWVNKRAGLNCRCDECTIHAFANGVGKIDHDGCCVWLHTFIERLRAQTGHLLLAAA